MLARGGVYPVHFGWSSEGEHVSAEGFTVHARIDTPAPEGVANQPVAAGRLKLSDSELQSWIDVRLKRQERLKSGGGLTLHAVVAEEALHRVVGSRAVMVDQLEHLIAMAKRKAVNLQVLPFAAGAHVGAVGPETVRGELT